MGIQHNTNNSHTFFCMANRKIYKINLFGIFVANIKYNTRDLCANKIIIRFRKPYVNFIFVCIKPAGIFKLDKIKLTHSNCKLSTFPDDTKNTLK